MDCILLIRFVQYSVYHFFQIYTFRMQLGPLAVCLADRPHIDCIRISTLDNLTQSTAILLQQLVRESMIIDHYTIRLSLLI